MSEPMIDAVMDEDAACSGFGAAPYKKVVFLHKDLKKKLKEGKVEVYFNSGRRSGERSGSKYRKVQCRLHKGRWFFTPHRIELDENGKEDEAAMWEKINKTNERNGGTTNGN